MQHMQGIPIYCPFRTISKSRRHERAVYRQRMRKKRKPKLCMIHNEFLENPSQKPDISVRRHSLFVRHIHTNLRRTENRRNYIQFCHSNTKILTTTHTCTSQHREHQRTNQPSNFDLPTFHFYIMNSSSRAQYSLYVLK